MNNVLILLDNLDDWKPYYETSSVLTVSDYLKNKPVEKDRKLVINLSNDYINPEKPDVPLNKNDAFQKVQKRHVQEKR